MSRRPSRAVRRLANARSPAVARSPHAIVYATLGVRSCAGPPFRACACKATRVRCYVTPAPVCRQPTCGVSQEDPSAGLRLKPTNSDAWDAVLRDVGFPKLDAIALRSETGEAFDPCSRWTWS